MNGTSGTPGTGSEDGSAPLSPTVGMVIPAAIVSAVRATMDTSGAGMTLVNFGKQDHDDEAGGEERVDRPRDVDQFRDLGEEDQDGERVDEADHDAARHEPHQLGDAEGAEHDLEQSAEDHGGDQVLEAVLARQRRDDQRDGSGGGGDHRRAAADDRDDDGHGEGGEQADARVHARR